MGAVTRVLARALTWPLLPAMVATALVGGVGPGDVPYVAAMLSCWLVGVVLTWRAVRQPAGWAFLGLGTAIAWAGFTEELALDTGDLLLATLADSSWVWWFVFAALALQLTVPGPIRTRWLPATTAALGAVSQLLMLLRTRPLEPPFAGRHSPWAVSRLGGVVDALSYAAVLVLGLCLLASVFALVRAWRRARDDERQQLLWLAAAVVPLAPAVVTAFVLSYLGYDGLAGWPLAVAFVALAAGAALSVLRYRLYDVERVVSESVAYALASGSVIVAFGLVVVVISRTTPLSETSQLSTVAATLAGVVVARQSYVWARRAVGRRLDRIRFDAVEAVRRGLRTAPVALDPLVAQALNDPSARILYPTAVGWVTEHGQVVEPSAHAVGVRGARVEFDPRRVDRDVAVAVAVEAAAEIDNVGLRAELARQLAVVTESRARLATAHQDERRRLERDLHDGAQQRILAIALQLQSARLNGAVDMLRAEVDRAVVDLGRTVQELRELASGMQPAALASGGLLAAVADLAERIPVPVTYEVPDRRFDAAAEGAAWFVVAEAVANAVKHASAGSIRIEVDHGAGGLTVAVSDTGVGGADPDGHGLRGLHDRVAAAGGSLTVVDLEPSGTAVKAVLPCE
jgi:signal transduction histidine kinase